MQILNDNCENSKEYDCCTENLSLSMVLQCSENKHLILSLAAYNRIASRQ